jgi:cobalt/nickel transport system permease protein
MKTFDASVGLILLTLYAFSVASIQTPHLSLAIPITIAALWRYKAIGVILKRMALLNLFTLMVIASALWREDYALAWLIAIRANAILGFALLLFYGKDSHEIAMGMQRLKFPHTFVAMLFFTAKFITLLTHTLQKLKKTAIVRGFRPQTNAFTYHTIAGVFGALLLHAFSRVRRFRNAIIIRAFAGHLHTLAVYKPIDFSDIFLAFGTVVSIGLHQGGIG